MLCVNFRTVGPVTLQKMFEYLFSSVLTDDTVQALVWQ